MGLGIIGLVEDDRAGAEEGWRWILILVIPQDVFMGSYQQFELKF